MKKIILSLLAISTISSADSVTLKCSFLGYDDGKIQITTNTNPISLTYDGPGGCDRSYGYAFISDTSISGIGQRCNIDIRRDDGRIRLDIFSNDKKIIGTCAKQSNAI